MGLKDNLSVFLLIGTVAGLLFPYGSASLITPLLFVLMSFSLCRIDFKKISKHESKVVGVLLFLNYIIHGGIILLLTHLFVDNPAFKSGLIVVAIMPPAIAIIPLSSIMKGQMKEALAAEVLGYIIALLVVPLVLYGMLGKAVSVFSIFKILVLLLLTPFIISRFIKRANIVSEKLSRLIINICFMFIFYILFSVNKHPLFNNGGGIITLVVISLITMFVVPSLAYFLIRKHSERVDFALFTAFKNGGLASGIIISLFGVEASVPIAVRFGIGIFLFIYLEWLFKKFK